MSTYLSLIGTVGPRGVGGMKGFIFGGDSFVVQGEDNFEALAALSAIRVGIGGGKGGGLSKDGYPEGDQLSWCWLVWQV